MAGITWGITTDSIANALFDLITKYGSTARVIDVIEKEQNGGKEND